MNIDQFLVLDAVVRLGSFSAAARELNRVQSAVSYNVKSLEDELGVEIFSRDTYRPSLTQAGESIYRKGKELLLNVEEIESLCQYLNQGEEAQVSLDIAPSCPIKGIAKILALIAETYPQTRINLRMEVFGGESLVLSEAVDISLTDVIQRDQRLEIVPWRTVLLIPVVSANHPLATLANEPLSRARIISHIQIVVSSSEDHNKGKTLGVMAGNQTWNVCDMSIKKELILQGLGWGNLPGYMVDEDLAKGRLVGLDVPELPNGEAHLHLVRLRNKVRGPVASSLWDHLIKAGNHGEA